MNAYLDGRFPGTVPWHGIPSISSNSEKAYEKEGHSAKKGSSEGYA
jgi:hypothetical protein